MSKTLYQPRDYQREALRALAEARASGAKRGLLEMASGLGKTLTSAFDIQRFMETRPRARVLFVCDQEIILEQSKEKYQKVFGDEYSYGFYTGNCKTEHQTTFLFATFQTLKLHREKFGKKAFDYIVVDEAHHTSAETYAPTVKYFRPQFLLGMTATPDRTDGKDIREIYGEPVYRLGLYEAWARGYLAEADYSLLIDDISKERLVPYLTPEAKYERVTLNQLNKVLFVPKRDDEIAKLVRQYSADLDNPTTMIFCASIEHAERMAEVFGGEAALVHSKQDRKLTQEILREFYAGNIRTVISVNMLNEGIDIPSADVLVFLRDTSSKRIFEQQLGRGLRLTSQKRRVRVLDFVPNLERILLLLEVKSKVADAVGATGGSSGRLPIVVDLPTPKFREIKVDLMELIERASMKRTWTDDELIALLQQRALALGTEKLTLRMLADDPMMPSQDVFYNHFGSWSNALSRAGLKITREVKAWTDEEIIRSLQDKALVLGRTPSASEVDTDAAMPSSACITKRFGSWSQAIAVAGLQAIRVYSYSREELLEALKVKMAELKRAPSRREMLDDPQMPSVSAYERVFGSWKQTLAQVDGKFKKTPAYTDKELLEILTKEAEKLGRVPTIEDFCNKENLPHHSTYAYHFGSWNKALKAAGLQSKRTGNISKQEALNLLQSKAQELGRTPKRKDLMADPMMPSMPFYGKLFGSWQNAVIAAGLEPVRAERKDWTDLTCERVIEMLLEQEQKLGRVPSITHFNDDPDLPSGKFITRLFGSWNNALLAAGLPLNVKRKNN